MPVRIGEAVWQGGLRDGQGSMKVQSGAFEGQYSFTSRFEEGPGTNPDELLGAAHAGCFSMQLGAYLADAGYPANRIHTVDRVHVDKVGGGFKITRIEIETEAEVPGIDEATFQQQAERAKQTCPVSQALTGVELVLHAKLIEKQAAR